jgi:hypothetical protein
MKLYRTLENGCHCYYSNKIEAKRKAKKTYKYYTENGGEAHSEVEIQRVDIPLTKKALIMWLNREAYYTGWTTH